MAGHLCSLSEQVRPLAGRLRLLIFSSVAASCLLGGQLRFLDNKQVRPFGRVPSFDSDGDPSRHVSR